VDSNNGRSDIEKEYLKKMNNISVPTDKKKLYEEKRLTNM
jgi:hypothetical protein